MRAYKSSCSGLSTLTLSWTRWDNFVQYIYPAVYTNDLLYGYDFRHTNIGVGIGITDPVYT